MPALLPHHSSQLVLDPSNDVLIFNLEVTPLDENDTMLLYGDMGNYSIGGFQFKFKVELGKWL